MNSIKPVFSLLIINKYYAMNSIKPVFSLLWLISITLPIQITCININ